MRKFNIKKVSEAGSLMVEAIAMLGLISMVTPVVYKKSAERMNELQDINAASQMRTLSTALDAYLADNFKEKTASGSGEVVPSELLPYLPQGMLEGDQISGVFGSDKYRFYYVRQEVPAVEPDAEPTYTLTGYVTAINEDGMIDPKRASRISTMIGSNGAMVEGDKVYGSQGVWEADAAKVMSEETVNDITDNSIVAASASAVGAGSDANPDVSKLLHREQQTSKPKLNTMFTDLYMYDGDRANDIMGVGRLLIGSQPSEAGAKGGQHTMGSLGEDPGEYSLYVGAVDERGDGSAYIQDALHAVEDQFIVEKSVMTYNPFTEAVGTEGEEDYAAPEKKGAFTVDTTGLYYTDPKEAEFKLTDNTLTYGNGNFIKAVAKGGNNGATENSFQVLSKEIVIDSGASNGGFSGDGYSSVETKTDLFVANHKDSAGNYIFENGEFNDKYKRIGDEEDTTFANNGYPAVEIVGDVDNYLAGRTVATEIETGYLKTHDFDVARLRAGRSNLDSNSKEGWNMDVTDDYVKLGVHKNASGSSDSAAKILVASSGGINDNDASLQKGQILLRTIDSGETGASAGEIALETYTFHNHRSSSIKMYQAEENQEEAGNIEMETIGGSISNTVSYGGNYNVDVKDGGDITEITDTGEIKIGRSDNEDSLFDGDTKYLGNNSDAIYMGNGRVETHSSGNIFLTAGEKDGDGGRDGYVDVNDTLVVSNKFSDGTWDRSNYKDSQEGMGDETNSILIRRGAIDIRTDTSYYGGSQGEIEPGKWSANSGSGYVLADRFVAENSSDMGGLTRDPSEALIDRGSNGFYTADGVHTGTEMYDHYMVDPAYTSVMHDIKLTSRGGARLSDILPDFINKGIYVVDNSYDEGVNPGCFTIYGDAAKKTECNTSFSDNPETDYASAYLGGIPAPQCPPGYAKVITLQPSGWTMGQVGTLVTDTTEKKKAKGRAYIQPVDNVASLTALGSDGKGKRCSEYVLNPDYDATDPESHRYICKEGSTDAEYGLAKAGSVQNYRSEAEAIGGASALTNLTGATDTFVLKSDLVDFAEQIDRLVQSSTYMKSAIKVKSTDDAVTTGLGSSRATTTDDFVGWDTYIGFIYPAAYWSNEALQNVGFNTGIDDNSFTGSTGNNGVYWNLFPVDKYSIEGYATVYCYFDRTGIVGSQSFDESMVDTTYNQFNESSHRDPAAGSAKCKGDNCSNDYIKRLFNPRLKYNDQW